MKKGVIDMKSNKYWNTIWSDRDQEFYWSGTKFGFVTAAILTSALWVNSIAIMNAIKNHKKSEEES